MQCLLPRAPRNPATARRAAPLLQHHPTTSGPPRLTLATATVRGPSTASPTPDTPNSEPNYRPEADRDVEDIRERRTRPGPRVGVWWSSNLQLTQDFSSFKKVRKKLLAAISEQVVTWVFESVDSSFFPSVIPQKLAANHGERRKIRNDIKILIFFFKKT